MSMCADGMPSPAEDLLAVIKWIFVSPASYIQPLGWNLTKLWAFRFSADDRNVLWESWVGMRKQRMRKQQGFSHFPLG